MFDAELQWCWLWLAKGYGCKGQVWIGRSFWVGSTRDEAQDSCSYFKTLINNTPKTAFSFIILCSALSAGVWTVLLLFYFQIQHLKPYSGYGLEI